MDPVTTTSAIIGLTLRNYVIHSKTKESYRLVTASAEKIAKAEKELERQEHETEVELEKLSKRMQGIVNYLEGPFLDLFKPFEGSNNNLQASLIEDLMGADAAANLALIGSMHQSICQRPEVEKLANGRRVSGSKATTTYLLFGNLGLACKQVDAAKAQHQKARLIATHMETFRIALDLQKERYFRVNQTLGALNVALIPSVSRTKKGFEKIAWMLDEQGRLPPDITADELKANLNKNDMDGLAACINIARCIYAILSEPLFDEKSELTQRAQALLDEGQAALDKIKRIEKTEL